MPDYKVVVYNRSEFDDWVAKMPSPLDADEEPGDRSTLQESPTSTPRLITLPNAPTPRWRSWNADSLRAT